MNSTNLQKVDLSSCLGITEISTGKWWVSENSGAFYECTKLISILLPHNLQKIGPYAFYGCNNLSKITIPTSVEMIDDYAFYGCNSLCEIVIPKNVTFIGDDAFFNCSSLNTVKIEGQHVFENAFFDNLGVGYLLNYAKVIYVNKTLTGTNPYLDSDSFTKVDNGDGYWKYTKI